MTSPRAQGRGEGAMSERPDEETGETRAGVQGLSRSDACSVCRDFDWAEEDAERMGDLSTATDWRVLRRRHQKAEHA
ncbi:hypothetical protein [Streptomyces sp. NPDC008125]|uniref:hypothetical protein n=1 Tax=Streptomyces sp. NPDC008125 TaxID=3364811 RepID=UPI0036E1554B